MEELSDKEKEVLDFLLDFVSMEVFSIEQDERDQGRLDYSLCSDDDEKLKITKKKVDKFKKRISNSNPKIAGYLHPLVAPNPLDDDFDELRERITKNFLLTDYYELFEALEQVNLEELKRYQFKNFIKSLGFDYKHLKGFIQGICDVNSFLIYKSFLEIPKDNNLTYEKVVEKLNNAFFRLEAFMNGSIKDYTHFDFNTSFTELFYFTRKPENYTYDNCRKIGQYWELTEQIRVDYDKTNFDNENAYDNKAFCKNCDVITSIAWNRLEEFIEFQTPDEIEEQTRKKSIADLMKAPIKAVEMFSNGITNTTSTKEENTNPHPRIFTSTEAYNKFKNLLDEFGDTDENLANYSFVFHRMKRDNFIYDDYQQTQFVFFLLDFDINISRIKPKSQLGKNDLRESIYNRI
uniref:hypothetical protein n=1 Tax=Flavobacterium sp. TaxID=239 RepID=UPI00404A0FA8